VKQSTQYVDGLGRPLQTVSRQATPGEDPKDIVMPVIYDNLGREVFKYLPYGKSNDGNYNDGSFKLNPFAEQEVFYKSVFKDAGNNLMYDGEQVLYSKTEYESSPLNRVTKAMAAGNSWAGSSKGTVQQYLLNNANDAVRIWNIANTSLNYNTLNQDVDSYITTPSGKLKLLPADGNVVETICDCLPNDARIDRSDRKGNSNLPPGVTVDDIEKPIDPNKLFDKKKSQDEKSKEKQERSKNPRLGDAGSADKHEKDDRNG